MHRILIILCLFPYIGFGFLKTDTQPWSLILATILCINLLLKNKLIVPSFYTLFSISIFIATSYFFIGAATTNGDINYGLTSLSYYLSSPIIALSIYNLGIPEKFGKIFFNAYLIWFSFAIVQVFLPEINSLLINQIRSSTERGLTSLAPEPVWYGRSVLLMMILGLILYQIQILSRQKFIVVIALGVVQIIGFTFSGTISFYLFLILLLYVAIVNRNGLKKIVYLTFTIFFIFLIISIGLEKYSDRRLFQLISVYQNDPSDLSKYGGFNMRVLNAPLAIKAGIIDSEGMGSGLVSEKSETQVFSFMNEEIVKEDSGRVNGGFVLFIYQIGIFGLFWIIGFYKGIFKNDFLDRRIVLFIAFSLTIILFFESSLTNPIAALIFGILFIPRSRLLRQNSSSNNIN